MKYANGIFRESIHSNLPDKRNVDNPKRQEGFKERWKLTRSLKKKEARRRWRQRQWRRFLLSCNAYLLALSPIYLDQYFFTCVYVLLFLHWFWLFITMISFLIVKHGRLHIHSIVRLHLTVELDLVCSKISLPQLGLWWRSLNTMMFASVIKLSCQPNDWEDCRTHCSL